MSTEAQRRASAAFIAKRQSEGWRKATFWVSPTVWAELERLQAIHGTKDKALEALLMGPAMKPETPKTPPVAIPDGVQDYPAVKLRDPDVPLRLPRAEPGSRLKKPKGSK